VGAACSPTSCCLALVTALGGEVGDTSMSCARLSKSGTSMPFRARASDGGDPAQHRRGSG